MFNNLVLGFAVSLIGMAYFQFGVIIRATTMPSGAPSVVKSSLDRAMLYQVVLIEWMLVAVWHCPVQ